MADGLTQTNEIASKTQREQERDGAMPDGLLQTNEIASNSQSEIWSYLDNLMTNLLTMGSLQKLEGDVEQFRQLDDKLAN